MGSNSGELKIDEPYSLPEGILLTGPISEYPVDGSLPRYGSGTVHLKITLLNYTDTAKTVFFPKGLIFKCNSPENHNLMILQTCWVCIKPNGSKTFMLDICCINRERKHPADQGITFEISGTSGSMVINKLLDLIGWKKINYEMIIGSSALKMNAYDDVMTPVCNIVWNLTDYGIDITAEDREFLENIPGLSAAEIPLRDSKGKYPVYFDEYVIKENR